VQLLPHCRLGDAITALQTAYAGFATKFLRIDGFSEGLVLHVEQDPEQTSSGELSKQLGRNAWTISRDTPVGPLYS
jgi:hypothetical protein